MLPRFRYQIKRRLYKYLILSIFALFCLSIVVLYNVVSGPVSWGLMSVGLEKVLKPQIRSTFLFRRTEYEDNSSQHELLSYPNIGRTVVGLIGQRRIFRPNNRTVYELPSDGIPIAGTLFVAHACTHSSLDFWMKTASNIDACSDCIGLAEETLIVNKALASGWVVVAIDSSDRNSGCWRVEDNSFVNSELSAIRQRLDVSSHLPLFAIGTSSGGSFVWGMAVKGAVDGLIVQVMSVNVDGTKLPARIPIILHPMKRDKRTFDAMASNFKHLVALYGSDHVKFEECIPLPVTSEYILGRMPELNENIAQRIVDLLKSSGDISNSSGYLVKDPTDIHNNWRNLLLQNIAAQDMRNISLQRGKSRLAKVLNRAWAFHEYCADYIEQDLKWMHSMAMQTASV